MNNQASSDRSEPDRTPSWVRPQNRKSPLSPDRIRVLVVDDMNSMRNVMSGILRNLGYGQIAEADSGDSALKRLESGGIDLLITDCHMPGMNGVQLIEQVRQSEQCGLLPILMVSADANRQQVAAAIARGVDGFMAKPFAPAAFADKLADILQRKRDVIEQLWAGKPTGNGRSLPIGSQGNGRKPATVVSAAPWVRSDADPVTVAAPGSDLPVAARAAASEAGGAEAAAVADAAAAPAPKRFKLSSI